MYGYVRGHNFSFNSNQEKNQPSCLFGLGQKRKKQREEKRPGLTKRQSPPTDNIPRYSVEPLRDCRRLHYLRERDHGLRPGLTSEELEEPKRLERENRELRKKITNRKYWQSQPATSISSHGGPGDFV